MCFFFLSDLYMCILLPLPQSLLKFRHFAMIKKIPLASYCKHVHKVCKCTSLAIGTYPVHSVDRGAIMYVRKDLYEINCLSKNISYVGPFAGLQRSVREPSTGRLCQRAVQFLNVLILTLLNVRLFNLVEVTELPPVWERTTNSTYHLLYLYKLVHLSL